MSAVSHSKRLAIALLAGISVLVVAPQASAQKSSRVRWQVRDKMRGLDQADDGLGHAMLLSPNGSTVYTAGSQDGSQGFALVAHDAQTGARRWVAAFPTGVWALDMAISPDGSRIFVAGSEGLRPAHFMTAAFDAETGARLWARQYLPNPSGGGGAPMTVATDGTRVFVTSAFPQVSGASSWDYGTIAYDAATGTLLWSARYDDPAELNDIPFAIAPNPDGQLVYVTGDGGGDFATIAYSVVDGSQMWMATSDSGASDEARALVPSSDGTRLYVTGQAGFDTRTVAYDAQSGVELGVATYAGGFD